MKKIEIDHLDTKIRNIENQLKPILSTPRNPQTKPSDKLVVEEFHDCLHVISDRLSAEMASPSDETPPLKDIVKRVVLLQKAAHAWTEGSSSSLASFEESCVTDDGAGLAGFKVYENPVFDGVLNEDDDGDDNTVDGYEVEEFERNEEEESVMIGVADQDEVQESKAGNDSVEKEVLEVDCQNEENINVAEKEEDDEEEHENDNDYEDENQEEGASKCCYKTMFWGLITVMVTMSISMDFLNFSEHQSTIILLAPT